ncbi:MAG: hypothetical protein JRH05_17070 [Deltaproteobacteria bacterium]|nr:hypothetical protein [Deltaproteobacteria bacterium]RLB40309.1 MAG: hypothetical protein DRH20_01665 [Deltaproteobacteria bacterium]
MVRGGGAAIWKNAGQGVAVGTIRKDGSYRDLEKDLLRVDGQVQDPLNVYRKVRPMQEHEVERDGLEEWGK